MKKLWSLLSLMVLCAVGTNAQTDVTSQYLQNADLTSLEGWSYGDPFNNETYKGLTSDDFTAIQTAFNE